MSAASSCGRTRDDDPWCRPPPEPARGLRPPRSRVSVWREPRMQAASALQIGFGLVGESAEHAADRVAAHRRATAPPGLRQCSPAGRAFDQMDAEPAENRDAHALGMRQRQERRDARAHGVAHDVGALDSRDDRAARARRPPWWRCDRRPGRRACSDAPCPRLSSAMTRRPARVSVATQPGLHPVHLLGGGKAVHQHDRIAVALVEIGDLDAAVLQSAACVMSQAARRRRRNCLQLAAAAPFPAATEITARRRARWHS